MALGGQIVKLGKTLRSSSKFGGPLFKFTLTKIHRNRYIVTHYLTGIAALKDTMVKLIKSTFYREKETRKKLSEFLLNENILSMNEQCKKFEEAFSKWQGRVYSNFVSSGSAANLVLIQALLNLGYLKKEAKVAVSSLTWATNVMPLIQLGLTPVPLDCEKENLNVSKSILEEAYKKDPSIKALFLTNTLGFSADIDEIEKFCNEKNILLLEDSCESLGSKHRGKLHGNFGLASTFSFFVGHHMSTIEGGMICTNDSQLSDMLKMVRAHGWDRNLDNTVQKKIRERHKVEPFYGKYTFYDLAYNARPTEINGFLGNTQLEFLEEIIGKREFNFYKFLHAARKNPDIIQLKINHMDRVSNFAFPLVFKSKAMFSKYKKKFEKSGVEIRPIISGNMHNQPFFKKYVNRESRCINADFIHEAGFYFGNNPDMDEFEISLICQLIEDRFRLRDTRKMDSPESKVMWN